MEPQLQKQPYGCFYKLGVCFCGCPCNESPTVLGAMLGPLMFPESYVPRQQFAWRLSAVSYAPQPWWATVRPDGPVPQTAAARQGDGDLDAIVASFCEGTLEAWARTAISWVDSCSGPELGPILQGVQHPLATVLSCSACSESGITTTL